jgi:dihydroneopterin aldolase
VASTSSTSRSSSSCFLVAPWSYSSSSSSSSSSFIATLTATSQPGRRRSSSRQAVASCSTEATAKNDNNSNDFDDNDDDNGELVDNIRDKIHLSDLQFHAYHGVLPAEKSLGQKFLINVELTPTASTLRRAAKRDDVSLTVDYAEAFNLIKTIVVNGPQRDLIETVGEDICREILKRFRAVDVVRVKVEKPCVAVDGDLRSLGVSLARKRRRET